MKKILTILASVATLIAFGDGEPINYATFEAVGYTAGEAFSTATNDYGGESTPLYWYTADTDASNVISNYAAEAYDNVSSNNVPIALRPDFVKDNDNSKFLQIETSGRLYRTIKDNEGHGGFLTLNPDNLANHTISVADAPVYLDTLVKFTAADSAFGDDGLENGDKIAISYVEHEAEDDDPYTNFVVRAGRFVGENSTLTNENYFVAVPEGFDKDAWHRLTVRTIADVGDGSVGFVVYLDETILTYSTEFDAGFGTLNPVAKNLYDTTKHALFPSAVGKDKLEGKTISYAAFSGNGSLDDVVFTTAMPVFIATNESVSVEFTVDSGVTAISVQVGEEEPVVVNMQTLTVALPPATTAFTVKATIDEGNGYGFSSMTIGEASYDTNPANITGYAGDTIVITTARNNFNVFDVNGDPISGKYQTLGAALAATDVAKIQLAYDYTVTDSDIPDGYIDIQQSITLDLNGKTLDGGESVSSPLFMVSDGNFVIIDSVGGGKVVYDGPGIVFGSTSYIGATSGDYGPTFDGQLFYDQGEGYVIRGKFSETGNTASGAEPAFLYMGNLGDGDSVTSECKGLVSGYWVVEPKGGSEPTTYEVTWTLTGGSASASAGDFEENDTIVFTAETGKTLSFVSIDGTEIADTSVYGAGSYTYTVGTADAVLVVTFTTPAPTQVAVPTALIGIMYDGTLKTGVVENVGYTLTGNTGTNAGEYEATATLAAGYIWSDDTTADKKIAWGILPNNSAEVVVTLASEIAEYSAQLEFPTATATIGGVAVEGTTNWVGNAISEPEAGATNTYTVTFTVTTANYAGSHGTATFKVWKAASGGGGYPTYIDTTDADEKAKYDAWKATYGDDTSSQYEDAFLLNCAPANVATEKAAFKFTKIAFEGGVWVTETKTKNTSGADYNGTVVVTRYSDVGCTTPSETGNFFKAELK